MDITGIIAGDEQGICNLIDMTYKGKDPQVGDFIIKTRYSKDEFIKKCEQWGLDLFEYPICNFCRKVIHGMYTISRNGEDVCLDCEAKEKPRKEK